MARPIVLWPDDVLDAPTGPVTDFGPALDSLLAEMLASMREAEGIGIAANQIGVPLRCAIVGREDGTHFEIVNPEWLERQGREIRDEGCLSVPGEWEKVARSQAVRVRYQDRTGAWHELSAEGRLAHVLEHEIDHLDGRVYVTHLSPLKRSLIRQRMTRRRKQAARGRG
jgi:peptide deformylase